MDKTQAMLHIYGFCCSSAQERLVFIYIEKTAAFVRSDTRFDLFLKKLQKLTHTPLTKDGFQENHEFIEEIKEARRTRPFSIKDFACSDSFVVASQEKEDLCNQIERLIAVLKQKQKHCCVLLNIGYNHSVVMEQYIRNDETFYIVYDPNNKYFPKKLIKTEEIAEAILSTVNRLKFEDLKLKYFLNRDEAIVLACYIYSKGSCQVRHGFITTLIMYQFVNSMKVKRRY